MAQIHNEHYMAGVRAAHDLFFSLRLPAPPDWRSVAPDYAKDATGFPAYCWISGFRNAWDFAADKKAWPENTRMPNVTFRRAE